MLGTAPDTRDAVVNKIVPNLMEHIVQEWVWEGADAQAINDNCKRVYGGWGSVPIPAIGEGYPEQVTFTLRPIR